MNFDEIMQDCKSRYRGFEKTVKKDREPRSFEAAISEKADLGLNPMICEIKYSSPSGTVREFTEPERIAKEMLEGGACALSVLTEERYFGGKLEYLGRVSRVSNAPVLRKDFIFDETQIAESYYHGADSLLLISSFFSVEELRKMILKSREFGMEPLVEVHSPADIETAESADAKIYVINNRDKDTLKVDITRSRLAENIDGVKVGASGISDAESLKFVLKYCDAALVGTAIMRSSSIAEAVRRFVHA